MSMQRLYLPILVIFMIVCSLTFSAQTDQKNHPKIFLLTIHSTINPATADYFEQGVDQAINEHASAVILMLDTPGGLDKSMRDIIQKILSSPIPIVTYVAPSGARAASAGTYILYASHIAAMAPGTNLGAATPIAFAPISPQENKATKSSEEETAKQKMLNDANAYLRSLAELRGRNIQWAGKAINQSASISAEEALKEHVINLIANDVSDLLKKINGMKINIQSKEFILTTDHAKVETISANWRTQFLSIITDPNIAYILLLIGVYGIFFEFFNPGFILPGVIGALALLIALYALQLLPINYVGLTLIFLGIVFLISEAFLPSGALAFGGIVSFVMGSILLFDSHTSNIKIAYSIILTVTAITAAFFIFIINIVIRARFRPVVSGSEQLIGTHAKIIYNEQGHPLIRISSELWQVESTEPLQEGQEVIITQRKGLILVVKKLENMK